MLASFVIKKSTKVKTNTPKMIISVLKYHTLFSVYCSDFFQYAYVNFGIPIQI